MVNFHASTSLILFNAMICHGHVPIKLSESVLIPLVKDKNGSIHVKLNYRSIAIANSIFKVFEFVLLISMEKICLDES